MNTEATNRESMERAMNNQGLERLLNAGFSRRSLGKALALATAGASLPFASEASLAQLSNLGKRLPPGAVKINANEFPMSLTGAAADKLVEVAALGNRYQYEESDDLIQTIARLEKVATDTISLYPGSSLALHHAMIALTGPSVPLITSSPGYEAAARGAEFIGATVIKVPLLADGAHDIKTMAAEAARVGAGLIYVCNPNNPTGSVSPGSEIDWLIDNKPEGTIVVVDEAYLHFSDEPSCSHHVAAFRDVVILRTFSKIYGMAGLRAGFVLARPDLLEKIAAFKAGALPATAMAAARLMLEDDSIVPKRKAFATAVRKDLCDFFDEKGFEYVPSHSFKVMVDTRRPVAGVIEAMKKHDIYVGRPWSEWPTHLRVSLGSESDMKAFKNAFLKVISAS